MLKKAVLYVWKYYASKTRLGAALQAGLKPWPGGAAEAGKGLIQGGVTWNGLGVVMRRDPGESKRELCGLPRRRQDQKAPVGSRFREVSRLAAW